MKLKSLFNFYQDQVWYVAQTVNELQKPLRLFNETILILTFLSVRGYKPGFAEIGLIYLLIITTAAIIGRLLTRFGVVAYTQALSNRQNPQLSEILERVKKIEEKL